MKRLPLLLALSALAGCGRKDPAPLPVTTIQSVASPVAPMSTAQMLEALRSGDKDRRWDVSLRLGKLRPAPVAAVLEVLSDPLPAARAAAARALGGMGEEARVAVGPLALRLADPDSQVRTVCATAIAQLGEVASGAATALVDALAAAETGESFELEKALVYGLPQSGRKALLDSASRLDDDRALRVFEALDSWGRGSNDFAVGLLVEALAFPAAARRAAWILGRTQNDASIAILPLRRLLLESTDPAARAEAARSLGRRASEDEDVSATVLPALREASKDPDAAVAKAAGAAIRSADPKTGARFREEAARIAEVAKVHEKEGQKEKAQALYQRLVDDYAGTWEASVAEERLKTLKEAR